MQLPNLNRTASVLALMLAATPAVAQDAAVDVNEPGAATTDIVVTGSRGRPRTITSSPTPIDVISGDDVARLSGAVQLRDALTQLVPSFQSSTVGSSSFNSLTRPAGLRGLSGVHVLVLVNGRRRHNSSIIDFNTGATSVGGNPVDLDLIPASAIERIEVLRDGASAQYGSDAIAGVINVILKDNSSGGRATLDAGQRYGRDGSGSDGETVQGSVSHGFRIGSDGSLTLSVEGKHGEPAVRDSVVPGAFYFPIAPGVPDPRDLTVNRRIYKGGLPAIDEIKFAQSLVLPLENMEFHSDGTFGYREAEVGQSGRKPNTNQNILEIYPDGFTPYYTLKETDFQLTGGLRGDVGGWQWDLASTYGRNYAENGARNSLNASLGPASPTTFATFSSAFDQWTNNLDFTRRFEFGPGSGLQVSAGGEFRYESYVTKPLDVAAYQNGGYFYPTGPLARTPAQVGAQGAIVVTPGDAADRKRNVWGVYADLAFDVTSKLLITAAGRFEDYDDSSGSVLSGKASARYEVTDWLNLRGAISNGFRAPSLAQQGFAQSSTAVNLVNGAYVPVETKVVRPESVIGAALGAVPLKPEKSTNYSLGFTLEPTDGFNVSVDAYQIDLDDRITSTGLLSGTRVRQILVANGFSGNQSVRFFTNAVSTRTRGIDVVAAYSVTTDLGRFRPTLGYNYNRNKITAVAADPAPLAGAGLTLFDRRTRGFFTEGPRSKLILGLDWSLGRFGANGRLTRYDKYRSLDNAAANDQSYGAKWVTDLEVSYDVTDSLKASVGAYNIFDVVPDRNTVANTIGISPYGAGPFGVYGGYYYGRLSLKL